MKHTKGEVMAGYILKSSDTGGTIYIIGNGTKSSSRHTTDEAVENVDLIEEAFNVTNECGLTPRQLLNAYYDLVAEKRHI